MTCVQIPSGTLTLETFSNNVMCIVGSTMNSLRFQVGVSVAQVIELLRICSGDTGSIPAIGGFVRITLW